MEKQISIKICSDIDYEDLIAEIYYGEQFVGVVDQEKGFNHLVIRMPVGIELPISSNKSMLALNLTDFEHAIEEAKQKLWDMRKTD